ncbi:GtrA family protein [Parasulfuritortus cantonensis]|uniref:GtrA family protein n=1 Tax=Parasulfuritortus cantonensis TaxID=2528202 RepID=A0A4R1BCD5_9PROT|nr:GtrA family protein [Parasulfuritortus cantonensis]TCJ14683.1 GtrA family protein [Parasulfuritortus cantonensis]
MKTGTTIALLYALFAAISTAANLGTQAIVVWLYHGLWAIEISVLAGTATGLPVKYMLEKRHIFEFSAENLAHDSKLFFLYSFLGLFTTAIFWGTELAFHRLFGTDAMRYLGGAIGLTAGYLIKYRLDKRFVFVSKTRAAGAT